MCSELEGVPIISQPHCQYIHLNILQAVLTHCIRELSCMNSLLRLRGTSSESTTPFRNLSHLGRMGAEGVIITLREYSATLVSISRDMSNIAAKII